MCAICMDDEQLVGTGGIGDIRLGCRCMFHYSCLVMYIKTALGDKEALLRAHRSQPLGEGDRGGIECPNAKDAVKTCSYRGAGKYHIQPADLDSLVTYRDESHGAEELLDAPRLTHEEALKLQRWLDEKPETAAAEESRLGSLRVVLILLHVLSPQLALTCVAYIAIIEDGIVNSCDFEDMPQARMRK